MLLPEVSAALPRNIYFPEIKPPGEAPALPQEIWEDTGEKLGRDGITE